MMTQQATPAPVAPEFPMVVRLQAQQWNQVLAALSEAPYRLAAPLIQAMSEQLQVQTQPGEPAPAQNGVDHQPPGSFLPTGDKP